MQDGMVLLVATGIATCLPGGLRRPARRSLATGGAGAEANRAGRSEKGDG